MSTTAGPSRRPRRPVAAGVLALLGALLVLAVPAGPAGAHEGPGRFTVTSMTRTAEGVVVEVHLTYIRDGHSAPGATVTAVAVADGATPTTLEEGPDEGVYSGTVDAPPGATVRFTSIEPRANLEAEAPPALPEPSPSDPEPTDDPGTTEAPADPPAEEEGPTPISAAEEEDAAESPAPISAPLVDEGDDGSGSSGVVLAAIAAAVAAVVVLGAVMLRRTKQLDPDPSDPDT